MLRKIFHWCVGIVGIHLLITCANEPADGPGTCKLQCSKAITAPNDYKIESMGTAGVNYRCPAGNNYFQDDVRFRITKTIRADDTNTKTIPVPNISVTPVLFGAVEGKYHTGKPYEGVVTDDSQFCSDQCGVVTLRYSFLCPAEESNEVTIILTSGALDTEEPFKITANAAAEEEDEEEDPEDDDTGIITTLIE